MSAAGERDPRPLRPAASTPAWDADPSEFKDALPLRLSLARGALGVELTRPLALGSVVLEELSLALVGLRYPVDLSKGVKQFRNRRATLERAVIRVDFDGLRQFLWPFASEALGEELLDLRLRPSGFAEPEGETQPKALTPAISVTLVGQTRALAFDWVLCSGLGPRWVLDGARGLGLEFPAITVALGLIDAVVREPLGAREMTRSGRTVEFQGLSRALCLRVLPSLGFRVPGVGQEVVQRTQLERGALIISLDTTAEPRVATRRGLRLSGLAELTRPSDEALAGGRPEEARRLLLEALERAPLQPDLLLGLAELDLAQAGHAESALSFLDELGTSLDGPLAAQHLLLQARALARSQRPESARETFLAAAEAEGDPLFAALLLHQLALDGPDAERPRLLERALEKAPGLAAPRLERLAWRVAHGELRGALADAEHLDQAEADEAGRAALAHEIGLIFQMGGFRSEAVSWFKRALRREPTRASTKLSLARAFIEGGETLRAVELLQSIALDDPEAPLGFHDQVHFELAQALVQEALDPSQAIAHLRAIDSRAPLGFAARVLEGRLAHGLGDQQTRVRAHTRLLEAIELGWIEAQKNLSDLVAVARLESEQGNTELALRAARHCRAGFAAWRSAQDKAAAAGVGDPSATGRSGQAVDSSEPLISQLEKALSALGLGELSPG